MRSDDQDERFPGRLFVVEGIDGSGKSTQLALLQKWLESEGYGTFFSEWNSSALVRDVTRRGKKKRMLTPMTFSLIHATDFADRTEQHIIPPLKAGALVLADRYVYTAFARDVARGVNPQLGPQPVSVRGEADHRLLFPNLGRRGDEAHRRRARCHQLLRGRHGSAHLSTDIEESFRLFQGAGHRRIRPDGRRVRPRRHRCEPLDRGAAGADARRCHQGADGRQEGQDSPMGRFEFYGPGPPGR